MSVSNIIVLCLVIGSTVAVDYCSKDMKCPPGYKHVGCNNPLMNGVFGPSCPSGAEVVKMTPDIYNAIVDVHNKWRNQQANGQTPHYQGAVRMATLTWDPELAKLAELNVRTCQFGHDQCENTKKYPQAGQNIAMSAASMNYDSGSDKDALVGLASGFFEDEHAHGKYFGWMKLINNFEMPPVTDMQRQIGHFTQVVRDETNAVGCAASKFTMMNQGQQVKATLMTCNYSRGNPVKGAKVYVAGPTASACKTGTNSKYPGLCSEMEKIEQPNIQW